jgi:hypothetical protein
MYPTKWLAFRPPSVYQQELRENGIGTAVAFSIFDVMRRLKNKCQAFAVRTVRLVGNTAIWATSTGEGPEEEWRSDEKLAHS